MKASMWSMQSRVRFVTSGGRRGVEENGDRADVPSLQAARRRTAVSSRRSRLEHGEASYVVRWQRKEGEGAREHKR